MIPTDSRAMTPGIGSVPSGPKMTRPAVTSPMNSICARPKACWCTLPSASSYVVLLHELQEGRIVREQRIYDFTVLLMQVGVLRAKPAV